MDQCTNEGREPSVLSSLNHDDASFPQVPSFRRTCARWGRLLYTRSTPQRWSNRLFSCCGKHHTVQQNSSPRRSWWCWQACPEAPQINLHVRGITPPRMKSVRTAQSEFQATSGLDRERCSATDLLYCSAVLQGMKLSSRPAQTRAESARLRRLPLQLTPRLKLPQQLLPSILPPPPRSLPRQRSLRRWMFWPVVANPDSVHAVTTQPDRAV